VLIDPLSLFPISTEFKAQYQSPAPQNRTFMDNSDRPFKDNQMQIFCLKGLKSCCLRQRSTLSNRNLSPDEP